MHTKVLLVDDDKNLLSSFKRQLRKKVNLVTSDSGEKGIKILKEQGPFAVVISDYSMPGIDGIEFLTLARLMAPDTVRIMLTGQADFNVAVDAINKGYIFRFLVKPCLPEVFLESLNEAINKNRQYQEQVDELKKEWSLELIRKTAEDTIKLIESLLEKRDPYTAGHQSRVAELAVAISREIGLPEEKMEGLKIASLIHDIGKAFVPAEILNKAGKLSEIEFSLIKTHPQAGYDVIKDIDFPWPIADIILQHHERLNGSGYPYGKIGNDIILEARILAVADVIEAMSLHRPYRPPLGTEKALLEITLNKGILYDPDVADACLKVFEKGFSFS